jgi:hypothetical protein
MKNTILFVVLLVAVLVIPINGCTVTDEQTEVNINRENSIPSDIEKGTPENDNYPPILHSNEYENPVPLAVINTAGAEDSPFIPADRAELYFFFTPDVRVPVEKQILDGVTGIYVSKNTNGAWQEPERVILQEPKKLSLDGCEFIQGNRMLFCSAREGYTGVHWFSAEYENGKWGNWKNTDFYPEYDVGELHIHENELYYHSSREGGKGGTDIWMLTKPHGKWVNPVNVEILNSEENEGMPYITSDGNEMWFNRWYMGSPAVYISRRVNGEWQEPELMISQFAGEPTLDKDGNIYFVHHYYKDGVMLEADIYIAYRK